MSNVLDAVILVLIIRMNDSKVILRLEYVKWVENKFFKKIAYFNMYNKLSYCRRKGTV